MRKEIVIVFCLLLAAVSCDEHDGHDHGDHDHGNHDHGNHDHGNQDHGSHDHGNDHGGHDHGNDHGGHDHGNHGGHDHGGHDHGGHDHGSHGHGDHDHGDHGNEVGDCAEHLNAGQRESGVKRIKPQGCHHSIDVLCDMDTDGGGWTVIQKRGSYGNDPDFFFKSWNEFKNGFGELDKEFWIGNYHINHLTEQRNYELRIDMTSLSDEHVHVLYETFKIDNETANYALHLGNLHEPNSANSLSTGNGIGFSTKDRDNDHSTDSCATLAKGGWWYNDCGNANLNGPHMDDPAGDLTQSIYWFNSEGNPTILKEVKMMVRPRN